MTCDARRGADNEWHCAPCALRWDADEARPPGCREAAQATVDSLAGQAADAAQQHSREQSTAMAGALWLCLILNIEFGKIPNDQHLIARALALFIARFCNECGGGNAAEKVKQLGVAATIALDHPNAQT